MTAAALQIRGLSKVYASGLRALDDVELEVHAGEIFALLGPNGAGKTTLIGITCGLVRPSSGSVRVGGHDVVHDFRAARRLIGLVPQELSTDTFESVAATVRFSRGVFGLPPNDAHLERILRQLSLWDKRDSKIMTLSGGMKRRVLIAKALAHEPRVLFLDEPTAGVDVTLRRDMWRMVRELREQGVTVILTTHYLEEAEEMADRIGVIAHGKVLLVERKDSLLTRLGKRRLTLVLQEPLAAVPEALAPYALRLEGAGRELVYELAPGASDGIAPLLAKLSELGLSYRDLRTTESSLEDIFVDLVEARS